MALVMSRTIYVSATDPTASCSSLTTALRHANAGDTVVAGSGYYAPSLTGEEFPLYVPPGVTLLGTGAGGSVIDGEGSMGLSFRPVQEGQSLLLLGDGSTLSGFTIVNGGGNGISNQPGARVVITRNEIGRHGQHGLLLSGPQEALVKDNVFADNGTRQFRPATPRPAAGRQGHHIFVQGKSGVANSMLIADNSMRGAFADAMALVVFFDEADGVTMHVRVYNNVLEQSERRGITIAGSFGPCHNRVNIDIQYNVIRNNAAQAIAAQAARPLVTQRIRDARLNLHITHNVCEANQEGVLLVGGFAPALESCLRATLLHNVIRETKRHAIRCIGGVGIGGYAAQGNQVQVSIAHNTISDTGAAPIFLQGGNAEGQEEVTNNTVLAQLLGNRIEAPEGACVVNDGRSGNGVMLAEPAPVHKRVTECLPYQA